jgi:uncharacterized integral membrane protein
VRTFRWFLIGLLALLLIVFAVANRNTVTLTLWPLPIAIDAPLYLVVLLTLLVGFLLGELAAWMNGHQWRRDANRRPRKPRAS